MDERIFTDNLFLNVWIFLRGILVYMPNNILSLTGALSRSKRLELMDGNELLADCFEYFLALVFWSVIYLLFKVYSFYKNRNPEFASWGLCHKQEIVKKSKMGESIRTEKITPYPYKFKDNVLFIRNLGSTSKEDVEKLLPNLSAHFSRKANRKIEFSVVEVIYLKKMGIFSQAWFQVFEPVHPKLLGYKHEDNISNRFYLGVDQYGKKVLTKDHFTSHCLMFLGIGGSGKSEAAKNCIEDYKFNNPNAKVYIVSAKPPIEDYWYMLSHPDVKYFNPNTQLDLIITTLEKMFSEYQSGKPSSDFKKAIWLFDECGQYLVKKKGEDKELAIKRARLCQLVQSHAELNRYTGVPLILCNQKQDADAIDVDKGLIHYIFTGRTKTPQMSQQLIGSQIAFNNKFHQGLLAGRDEDGNTLEVKFRYLNDLTKSVLFTRPVENVLREILNTKERENSAYSKAVKLFPDLEYVQELSVKLAPNTIQEETPAFVDNIPEEVSKEPASTERPANEFKIIKSYTPTSKKYVSTHVILEVLINSSGEVQEILVPVNQAGNLNFVESKLKRKK